LKTSQRKLAVAELRISQLTEITSELLEQAEEAKKHGKAVAESLRAQRKAKVTAMTGENELLTAKVTALELTSKHLERELQSACSRRTEQEVEARMQYVVEQEAAVAKQEAALRAEIKKQQKKAEAEQSRTESKLRKQVDMYEERNVILKRLLQWDIRLKGTLTRASTLIVSRVLLHRSTVFIKQ
jgi:hypothetical protein